MSLVCPLLSVPRKTTSEVDYASPIRHIISSTYQESPDSYSEEIASLNRARQDAVRGSAGSDVTARDLLYRYFGQLELLELRFPEIRVPFPWNDAFNPSKNISQLSLAYEKASVIFNIGATLSALASEQNRTSPDGLKRSFNFYRSAAGMFTYINDNFLHAPSTDLSRDLVKVLVTLMTAQAIEVFLERMNEEKRTPGLKSKICAQVAAVYAGVVEEVRDHVTKAIFDRSWLVLVQTKAKYFGSLAQYNRSLADSTGAKHGDAVGRLGVAENLAKEAHRISLSYGTSYYASSSSASQTLPSDAGTTLQEMCSNHVKVVSEARNAGIKDNDLIYHALIPSEASLPAIEKAANVAEPIPIQEIYSSPDVQKLVGQDIFIKLVPLSVIESSSLYSEEKAKILRTQGEACELADVEMANGLEHLGLPGSLNKFKSNTQQDISIMADPGPSVKSWSHEIQAGESERGIESYVSELTQLREKSNADIGWITNQLDTEQRECEQARVRFEHHFEQSPSSSHTRNWRNDLKNDKDSLNQAKNSDDQVLSLWSGVREDVHLLSAGSDVLEGVYADAIARAGNSNGTIGGSNLLDLDLPDTEGEEITRRITAIQDNYGKLLKIKKERSDILADLKERIHNDDISQLLILNRKSHSSASSGSNVEPTLFAAELEKFRPHQARIQATLQAQSNTLNTISSDFERLVGGKKGKEIQGRFAKAERVKKDLHARFKRAYEAYREVRSGVTKGTDFYRELSGLLATLRSEVSHFVSSRANERSSMISSAEMKKRLAGTGSSGSRGESPYGADSLDRAFDSMSFSSSRSPAPVSPTRSQTASSYSSMPHAPSSSAGHYSSYASPVNGHSSGNTYSQQPYTSSTPSLPPKPSAPQTSSYSQQPQYRQASGSGLPPPPSQSQPQYSQQQSHYGAGVPPPPSAMSYTSSSTYHTAPQSGYTSPAPSSYASPTPPPSQPPYSGYQPYSPQHHQQQQQPTLPPRPPAQQQPSYSSYSAQPPPPPNPGSSSPYGNYGQAPPPPQPYSQHQPAQRQDSGYGYQGQPPPQPPRQQRTQYQQPYPPPPPQHPYQRRY